LKWEKKMPATQKNEHKILEDLMRMAEGAFGTVAGFRSELQQNCKEQVERFRGGLDAASKEELEVIKSMQVKILEQQQEMLKRLENLEGKK
jgi:BMFP domain-containing protein YqiC